MTDIRPFQLVVIALLAFLFIAHCRQASEIQRLRKSNHDLIGRVQACEVCHFGGDAETVTGRLEAIGNGLQVMSTDMAVLESQVKSLQERNYDIDQLRVDADITRALVDRLEAMAK